MVMTVQLPRLWEQAMRVFSLLCFQCSHLWHRLRRYACVRPPLHKTNQRQNMQLFCWASGLVDWTGRNGRELVVSQHGCAGARNNFFYFFAVFELFSPLFLVSPLELLKEAVLRFKVSLQQSSELCA